MIFPAINGFGIKFEFVCSSLFIYPFPTPSPEMYSSPLVPCGNTFLFLFKIYICVLLIGVPIVTSS